MSRDWTPAEWDIVHNDMPDLRETFDSLVWQLEDGTKVPMVSDERKSLFRQYPKLNLVGCDVLHMCYSMGIFDSEKGKSIIQNMEDILNGKADSSEFADKVRLWYEGKLVPGYYMTDNNVAIIEEIEKCIS